MEVTLEKYLRNTSDIKEEVTKETLKIIHDGLEKEEKESQAKPSYFFINPDNTPHYELIGKFFKAKTTAGALLRMKAYAKEKRITSPLDDLEDNLYFEIDHRCKYKKLMALKEKGFPEGWSKKKIRNSLKESKSLGHIKNSKALVDEVIMHHESDGEDSLWTQITSVPRIDIIDDNNL